MKRILLALLLLLFAAPLSASDSTLYLTFDQIAVAARGSLGYDTTSTVGLSDAANARFAREGLLALQPFMKGDEVEWIFTTTYMEHRYAIDSDIVWISSVTWRKQDSAKVLLPITMKNWGQVEHKHTMGAKNYLAHPSYYDWSDAYLLLYPIPSLKSGAYDTIRVIGYQAVSDLDTITTMTHLKERYRIAVKKYVTWQAAKANYDVRTNLFMQEYKEAVAILRGEKANAKAAE